MADPTDVSGVLGFSQDDLRAMLAGFEPSQQDQDTVHRHSMQAAAFTLLANAYKPLTEAFGRAGLAGMDNNVNEITRLQTQRAQNLDAALKLRTANMQQRAMQGFNAYMSGAQPTAGPALGNAGAPQSSVPGPAALTSMGVAGTGAPTPENGAALGVVQDQLSNMNLPRADPRANVVPEAIAGMIAFGNTSDAFKAINDAGQVVNDRNGMVMTKRGEPLYQITPHGIQVFGASARWIPFTARNDTEATQEGAIAAARKRGEQSQSISMVDNLLKPGESVPVNAQDYADYIRAHKPSFMQDQPAAAPGAPPSAPDAAPASPFGDLPAGARINLTGPVTADQVRLAVQGATQQQTQQAQQSPQPAPASAGFTPGKAGAYAEAAATEGGKGFAAFKQSVYNAGDSANKDSVAIGAMQESLKSFTPGPFLPMRATAAAAAQAIPWIGDSIANRIVPNAAEALPAITAMGKFGVTMTAEQARQFGTREAVQVVQLVQQAQPNAAMVPGAPQLLLQFRQGMNDWAQARAQALTDYAQHPGATEEGFRKAWDNSHPMTLFTPPLDSLKDIIRNSRPSGPGVRVGGYDPQRLLEEANRRFGNPQQ